MTKKLINNKSEKGIVLNLIGRWSGYIGRGSASTAL